MQSSSPCNHPSGKHHFKVHDFIPGQASILRCQHDVCKKHKVVEHDDLVACAVAA